LRKNLLVAQENQFEQRGAKGGEEKADPDDV